MAHDVAVSLKWPTYKMTNIVKIINTNLPLLVNIQHSQHWFKVQGSLLFVTYTIIQGIISSEMLVRTGPLNGKCKKIKNNNKIKIT